MRSLFLKIFVWFWFAQALIGAVFVLVTVATWPRPSETGWQDVTRDTIRFHSHFAAALLQQEGSSSLKHWLNGLSQNGTLVAGVFDSEGKEITGRTVPADVRQWATQYSAQTPYPADGKADALKPLLESRNQTALAAVYLPTPGRKLVLAARLPRIEIRSWGAPSPHLTGRVRVAVAPGQGSAPSVVMVSRTEDVFTVRAMEPPPTPEVGFGALPAAPGPLPFQTKIRTLNPVLPPPALTGTITTFEERRWAFPLRLGAVFLTAGIFCYALAHYLALPATELRRATRRLADGDLSTRIGPAMGRRRDELADLGHDFDRMAGRLESLVQSERRLLGDISHELRSPLARLQVALELARQDAGHKAQPSLDRIEDEADKLNDLIAQLLTLTRLENQLPGSLPEQVDLEALMTQVAQDADFEAQSLGKRVHLEMEPFILDGADGNLLHRAVENVVRNAVRYSAPDTTVEMELKTETQNGTPHAIIRVRDYGPGVPEAELRELFRPFYRVNAARETTSGGVGLGLSITDRAVQLHGGQVSAANAPGGGLVVEIKLPTMKREPRASASGAEWGPL